MKATHKDWILFNGRIVNTKEDRPMVPIRGEGLQFGDGIYEFLGYTMGSLIYWIYIWNAFLILWKK